MGLLRAELFKLIRHVLSRWLGPSLLVLVLLRGLVWPPDPNLPWTGLWSYALVLVSVIMLTTVMMGQEFSEGTFRSLVSRGLPRWWLLVSKFMALVLVGGIFLVVIEGLATLLGARSELRWDELVRAWFSFWPYVALLVLLTVLARNGGLALVLGVLWIALEYAVGMLLGAMAFFSELPGWEFFTPQGLVGTLFQGSLSYHSANWTYLAETQRIPVPMNALLWAKPVSVSLSALVLAAYTLLGLGLSVLIVHRRDVTEVVAGKKRWFGFARRRAGPRPRPDKLPRWTGKGPMVVRLVRADIFKLGRTSLVKIGAVVALIFPLALWGAAAMTKAAGLKDVLFSPGAEGNAPMAYAVSLLMVGPLATVIGVLAVGNELNLGTRRVELTRGVTRLQTIVAQSLALMLTLGAVLAFLMAVTLLIGANVAGNWPLGDAALTVLVGTLAAGAYIGAAQVGGALTRSALGAMAFGLLFLVADWFAILAPTLMIDDPGVLLDLGRYAVFANTFALANRGQIIGVGAEWQHFGAPAAVLILVGYIVISHGLAALIARWRDA